MVAIAAPLQAQCGDGTEAEDEDRIQHQVEQVGQPQRAHGARGIAGAPEDAVDQEEQQDRDVPAEHDGGEGPPLGGQRGAGTQQTEQVVGIDHAGDPQRGTRESRR